MDCAIQKENEDLKLGIKNLQEETESLKDRIRELMQNFGKDKREVFIVGGGSSLKDFSFEKLKDKNTIAVNMAALDVPNPTYCITGDSNIFRKVQEEFFKRVNTTWVMVTNLNHPVMKWKDGRFEHRTTGFVYNPFSVDMLIKSAGLDGIGFSFNDFRTGYNSGFCALQLAVLLGYTKIYLLGMDLQKGIEKTHYHNRYQNRDTISQSAFKNFFKNFVIALDILKEKTDIEVISCSKISRLNEYIPYQSFASLENNV